MKQNILLGMPTLIQFDSLQKNIDFCCALGLDLLELNMNLPYLQVDQLKTISLPQDINYSIHLPEELNVWDFNSKIRKAYFETLADTITFAEKHSIKILNMHMNSGVYFTLPHKKVYLFQENPSFFNEKTQEFSSFIKGLLNQTDIKLHIENTGILDKPFIREAVSCLLKNNSFCLTWDVGHDASNGNKDFNFYKKHVNKIKHMHLHDAKAHRNHLPLGEGDLDIKKILLFAGNSIDSIIFETKTSEGLKKSLTFFRELI